MGTQTQFLKLYKPTSDEIGWSALVDGNFDILDTFVRQFMSIPNFQGAWQNAHAYAVGQLALDTGDGNFYMVAVAHTSAALPTTFTQDRVAHPTFWTLDNNAVQGFVTAAANSASAAASSATQAAASLNSFKQTYYGSAASDPLTDPLGGARTAGDLYFNTTSQRLRVWTGTVWSELSTSIPEAPVNGTTFGRNNGTWVNVIPTSGNTVFNGILSHANAIPTNAANGQSLFQNFGGFNLTGNLYADNVTPAPGSPWRYRVANTSATCGWLITEGGNPGFGSPSGGSFQISIGRDTTFAAGALANMTLAQLLLDVNGNFGISGTAAFKPGGGVWSSGSDSRIKNVTGPYPRGLAELLEMLPKTFTYKGNDNYVNADGSIGQSIHTDTTTQHIGLIAQDCEPYMPELVSTKTAFIDGVLQNDVRNVDATGVIYALVNAVAELDARLKVLEP